MRNNVLKFKNVIEVNGIYMCPKWEYKNVTEVYSKGLLCINYDLLNIPTQTIDQKNLTITHSLDMEVINNISNKILKREPIQKTITLNIRKLGNQEQYIQYNRETKDLEIIVDNENIFIDVINGIKRIIAVNLAGGKAEEMGLELQGDFVVQINRLDTKDAWMFLKRQEWNESIQPEGYSSNK